LDASDGLYYNLTNNDIIFYFVSTTTFVDNKFGNTIDESDAV